METVVRDLAALFYIVPLQAETGTYTSTADVPDYVSRAVPYFLLLIALEFTYGKYRNYKLYTLKDAVMSISLGIVQQLIGVWMKEALIFPYHFVYRAFGPLREAVLQSGYWPNLSGQHYDVLLFIVGFLGCDLGYYFLHRTAHEWQLMWSAHSVHHSGERYNLATALRQGSFQATYSWFFYIPLAAMGLPVTHFIRHNRLNTIYQFWIHTEVIGRCPWFVELVMNTASHHRPHHRPPGNCNYAGVLIVWDRLFCTFQSEYDLPKTNIVKTADGTEVETTYRGVIYGLARPLDNYDPVYANVCHLLRLCEPKSANGEEKQRGGNPAWLLDRIGKLLKVSVTRRIRQDLRVTMSPEEFMPDILQDWRVAELAIPRICEEEGCPYFVGYLKHGWRELWRLPPTVNESALRDSADIDTSKAVGRGADGTVAEFSTRDLIFLQGRRARESPALSWGVGLIVTLQFLLSLVVGYSFLLQSGGKAATADGSAGGIGTHNNDSVTSTGAGAIAGGAAMDHMGAALAAAEADTARVCNAMICVGCVLLLQTIKFYYK